MWGLKEKGEGKERRRKERESSRVVFETQELDLLQRGSIIREFGKTKEK